MSIKRSPLAIVYTKTTNFIVDLLQLQHYKSITASELADFIVETYQEVNVNLEQAAHRYKKAVDHHRREKIFAEGDLVMIHLQKSSMPLGIQHKLQFRKFGP